MKTSIIKSKYIFSITTIIVIIGLWFFLSWIVKNTYIFTSFKMLLDGAKNILVDNFNIIILTVLKIVIGVIIASIISVIIFIIYVLKKDLIGFFTPILSFIHVVPTIGISLYLYFFLDKSIIPFILVIMVTVPIMVEGLITAYDNIDKGITDVLKLEQISFFKKLFKIYLPIMTPYILMILLQSFSLGLKAMVMGEYLCMSPKSLGYLIYEAQNALITENMIAILVILFIISIVCEIIIKILQARINKYLLVK
jgi:ABC-type nitrate/sulfonate/bicarbonate transport system permease component